MLKDGISVAGLTMKYLFSALNFIQTPISVYSTERIKTCIVFHRYHEKGKTFIRQQEMHAKGKEAKLSENIVGYKANAHSSDTINI